MNPDHQADPSPRESEESVRAELAAYHRFHEAINGEVGFLRAEWGDPKEHANAISAAFSTLAEERLVIAAELTTRTSPQLSEGMVERAAMAIQWEFGWSAVEELHDVDEMLRARRYARAALTAGLADRDNE